MSSKPLLIVLVIIISVLASNALAEAYEALVKQTLIGDTLYTDIYLRTLSGSSQKLGDATLVINFNTANLKYIGKVPTEDGIWDSEFSQYYNDISSSNVGYRASLDVTRRGNEGLEIPADSSKVGRLKFAITQFTGSTQIQWDTRFTTLYSVQGEDMKGRINFLNPDDFAVPVELTTFEATSYDAMVNIAWATRSQTNTLGFHVYRSDSENGNYEQISSELIPGAGTSTSTNEYSYMDQFAEVGKRYYYKLADIDLDGTTSFNGPISVNVVGPAEYELSHNYPNPFNPVTTINFKIKEKSLVSLSIYNLRGQIVRKLIDKNMKSGSYEVQWDGRDDQYRSLPSGTYFYRISTKEFSAAKKLQLLK